MNSLRLNDALVAARTGDALPIRTVRHRHLSAEPMVICAYHLANEAGAVVGLMYGTDRDAPTVVAMGNPLDRDLRFATLALAAGDLVAYFEAYDAIVDEVSRRSGRTFGIAVDTPQVVTPNAATATWLGDVLGRSLRYLKPAEQQVDPLLPVLGAHLTVLAQSRRSPLSALMLPATSLLTEHYVTGQLAGETESIQTTLGWIAPAAGLTGRASARAAEKQPPAGPEPDAAFDASLYPAVHAWRDAVAVGTDPIDASEQMRAAVTAALLPGYEATFDAINVARALPAGAHDADRHRTDRIRWASHLREVRAGTRGFRRLLDAINAARVLDRNEKDLAEYARQQALDDPAVVEELLAGGDALAGEVTFVDLTRRVGRAYRPLLRVAPDPPYPRAPGAVLHLLSNPNTAGLVLDVDPASGEVLLEMSGGMGRGAPTATALPAVGDITVLTIAGPNGFFPSTLPQSTPWTHVLPTPPDTSAADATGGPSVPSPVTPVAPAAPLATVIPLPRTVK